MSNIATSLAIGGGLLVVHELAHRVFGDSVYNSKNAVSRAGLALGAVGAAGYWMLTNGGMAL